MNIIQHLYSYVVYYTAVLYTHLLTIVEELFKFNWLI